MADIRTTIDHDTIKSWAERRGGRPARVRAPDGSDHKGILRIVFDRADHGGLQPVLWDVFFEVFEESGLAFDYDPRDGSRFFKFVVREL